MLSEMILSAVPDPEYEDLVAHNPVDDQIGPDNHELTGMRQPAFSAAVRKEREAVRREKDVFHNSPRGRGIDW